MLRSLMKDPDSPAAIRPDTAPQHLHYALAPCPHAVSRTCMRIETDLIDSGLPVETAGRVVLVCAEALNNIVEHAHQGNRDGWIKLAIEPDGPYRVTLRDNGRPIPGGIPPLGAAVLPGQSIESLSEGGYGWLLIRSLATAVEYDHADGENMLRLTVD